MSKSIFEGIETDLDLSRISMGFASVAKSGIDVRNVDSGDGSYANPSAIVPLRDGSTLHFFLTNDGIEVVMFGSKSSTGVEIGLVTVGQLDYSIRNKSLSINGYTLNFSQIPRTLLCLTRKAQQQ